MYPNEFYGQQVLLEDPDPIFKDDDLLYVPALWFYMTPNYPKSSAHLLVTGFYEPSKPQ